MVSRCGAQRYQGHRATTIPPSWVKGGRFGPGGRKGNTGRYFHQTVPPRRARQWPGPGRDGANRGAGLVDSGGPTYWVRITRLGRGKSRDRHAPGRRQIGNIGPQDAHHGRHRAREKASCLVPSDRRGRRTARAGADQEASPFLIRASPHNDGDDLQQSGHSRKPTSNNPLPVADDGVSVQLRHFWCPPLSPVVRRLVGSWITASGGRPIRDGCSIADGSFARSNAGLELPKSTIWDPSRILTDPRRAVPAFLHESLHPRPGGRWIIPSGHYQIRFCGDALTPTSQRPRGAPPQDVEMLLAGMARCDWGNALERAAGPLVAG